MKACFLACATLFLLASPSFATNDPKVLVLAGGGFDVPKFMGMLEGVERAGWTLDVIVGTCGGSIAAAVAAAIPGAAERRKLVLSQEFHNLLLNIKIETPNVTDILAQVMSLDARKYPDLFSGKTILDVPQDLSAGAPFMNRGFGPRERQKYRVAMIAAELQFGPAKAGAYRGEKKSLQEVLFTDEGTAKLVKPGFTSIGALYPESAVDRALRVETGFTLAQAARASISDPLLMAPARIDGRFFITGAVNLWPLEIARQLGGDVLFPKSAPYEFLEAKVIDPIFGYGSNARLESLQGDGEVSWVDLTDDKKTFSEQGLSPRAGKGFPPKIESGVPAAYEDYKKKAQFELDWGIERMSRTIQARAAKRNARKEGTE